MTRPDTDFILRVLKLAADYDFESELGWTPELEFFIHCPDFFHWGSADVEPITEDDLALLERSAKDDDVDGPLLFCARKRGMRPQGACYENLTRELWHLYDACGPERELGLTNPQKRKEEDS